MRILYKKLNKKAVTPTYGSQSAAGADLYAILDGDTVIYPGETQLIHTGIAMEIPEGYVGLICARSGLATMCGVAPANKVGVIDSDYRGEIIISLFNHGGAAIELAPFERIAQLVIVPYLSGDFVEADDLSGTGRGDRGFGSTGRI